MIVDHRAGKSVLQRGCGSSGAPNFADEPHTDGAESAAASCLVLVLWASGKLVLPSSHTAVVADLVLEVGLEPSQAWDCGATWATDST
jgi:hypothetical protein